VNCYCRVILYPKVRKAANATLSRLESNKLVAIPSVLSDNFAEDIALPIAQIKARAIRTKKLNITCKVKFESLGIYGICCNENWDMTSTRHILLLLGVVRIQDTAVFDT